jgi:predicted ATP-grasp superfamily ATP-dependent carboligase
MTSVELGQKKSSDSQEPYAIIIGLDCIQGLQSARILSSRNVPVIGIAKSPDYYSCKTRVCDKILYTNTGNERLIELLEQLGPTFSSKPVLFPCQDKNVLVIAQNCHRLEQWYHIILPDAGVVEMMMNKASFYRFAQEKGLPIPTTFILESRKDAECAAANLAYPCIMKPPLRLSEWSKHTKAKAIIANSPEEMLALYDRYHQWIDSLIVQDLIQGGDANHYTCNCYLDRRGEVLVTVTSRKLRQWQPKTGQACLAIEARNEIVEQETVRLFTSVNYCGLGYLEMKLDDRSGKYYIIEPNIGRPTGRAAIAEAGGVEFMYTMYCDAVGLPLPTNRQQKYKGVKWIHLLRDLQAAAYHWRHGELTLKEWWHSVRGRKAYAIFSWSDPMPFLTALLRAVPVMRSAKERGLEDE